MFSKIKYAYQLSRLQREKRQTSKYYDKKYEAAKKASASYEDLGYISQEEFQETDLIDQKIAELQTTFLRQRADELLIPAPEFNPKGPDWIETWQGSGRWHLSLIARAALSDKIHATEMAAWEGRTKWIVLLIGLVGALTGLIAVFKR